MSAPWLPILWVGSFVVIAGAAWRATTSARAQRVGLLGVAFLYIGAGALVNAVFLLQGDDYDGFASGAYVAFVDDTWQSLVVPNAVWFISALVAFEASVGVLVLAGGRRAELGLGAAMAFHVALLSFGWGFYLWSLPMLVALGRLLVVQRRTGVHPLLRGDPVAPRMSGRARTA